ncbi:hypothetical protein DFS33DRAFT_1383850 [Desarmillaria ectypa]|nr:hypothetical protein DFS33DRAFT_1383850 [Desarmillaria ectypa]
MPFSRNVHEGPSNSSHSSEPRARYCSLLVELCSTNDNLSPSTKSFIRSNILPELHADACLLDTEIDYLSERLDAVQKKRDEITSMEKTFQKFLSPVRVMPSEILMEIFNNVARNSEVENGVVKEAAWTLSHVCHSWRVVALACRELWSTISISISDYNIKNGETLPVLLQTVLERSGNRLLNVSLTLELTHSDSISEEDALTDAQRGAIKMLFNESTRWLSASLSIPSGTVADLLYPRPTLPALVSLRLQTRQRWAQQAYNGPDISLWCPHLTSLSLLGVPPTSVSFSWNSLSHVSVQMYDNEPSLSVMDLEYL